MDDKKEVMRTKKHCLISNGQLIPFKEYNGMTLTPKVIIEHDISGEPDFNEPPSVILKNGKICYALPGGGSVYL